MPGIALEVLGPLDHKPSTRTCRFSFSLDERQSVQTAKLSPEQLGEGGVIHDAMCEA